MTLLSRLPIMPIYYEGKTKFAPIHVTDLIEIILQIIENQKQSLILECIGPETLTFKEIILKLLKSINKKRLLLPLPLPIASLTAKFLQLLPNPLLTEDQLNLLKYDNINSGINKTNFDLGILSKRKFEQEINKYSFNWRTGGQFSKLNNSEK